MIDQSSKNHIQHEKWTPILRLNFQRSSTLFCFIIQAPTIERSRVVDQARKQNMQSIPHPQFAIVIVISFTITAFEISLS